MVTNSFFVVVLLFLGCFVLPHTRNLLEQIPYDGSYFVIDGAYVIEEAVLGYWWCILCAFILIVLATLKGLFDEGLRPLVGVNVLLILGVTWISWEAWETSLGLAHQFLRTYNGHGSPPVNSNQYDSLIVLLLVMLLAIALTVAGQMYFRSRGVPKDLPQ